MVNEKAVIFGATSAIGQALARELAKNDVQLVLVARDAVKLEQVVADVAARGGVDYVPEGVVADLADITYHETLFDGFATATSFWLLYGTLPDQKNCEEEFSVAEDALMINFVSAVSLLSRAANLLGSKGLGSIVVVSSVAGDRGRQSNYVYGAAKGGLSIFCAGLRNRLFSSGVNVLTVKPGFVDSPMTAGIEKKPAALWATPERVASDMVIAWKRKKSILYTPWFWRFIMLIIKLVPEPVFKRLKL